MQGLTQHDCTKRRKLQKLAHPIPDFVSHVFLGHQGQSFYTPIGREQRYAVGVHGKASIGCAYVIGSNELQPLALQFIAGVLQQIFCFCGESNSYLGPTP